MTDETTTPAVPDGWEVHETRWHTWLAKKWFGFFWREVAVAKENGPDGLHAALTAVDQEHALREQGAKDATNAHADALDAQAAALRASVSEAPVAADPPAEPSA